MFTPQAIEHASLESFHMQCSWVTSYGQYEDTFKFTARSPPTLSAQAIEHASLESFQMQCSWVTSNSQ